MKVYSTKRWSQNCSVILLMVTVTVFFASCVAYKPLIWEDVLRRDSTYEYEKYLKYKRSDDPHYDQAVNRLRVLTYEGILSRYEDVLSHYRFQDAENFFLTLTLNDKLHGLLPYFFRRTKNSGDKEKRFSECEKNIDKFCFDYSLSEEAESLKKRFDYALKRKSNMADLVIDVNDLKLAESGSKTEYKISFPIKETNGASALIYGYYVYGESSRSWWRSNRPYSKKFLLVKKNSQEVFNAVFNSHSSSEIPLQGKGTLTLYYIDEAGYCFSVKSKPFKLTNQL